MIKYLIYIFLCIILGFLDFHFNLRGVLSITFDVVLSIYIIVCNRENIKTNFILSFDYRLLCGVLLIFSMLFFKEGLICFFYNNSIDYYDKVDFYFIVALVIKSFTEELIFRGYWLKNFLVRYNILISILIVSLGFAFLHFFGRNNAIFAFISSLALSYIFYKSKSIMNNFLIHVSSNLFVIFLFPSILSYYSSIDERLKIISICSVFIFIIFILKILRDSYRE
ncbi:lysostaphin resistance A-like protein [Flavobacterium sp. FlaQc-47]|uniref:CPBP family intramembrane glutamic endopeptidase n=1 Tax=Flavobacterium sp. FlaQc-47 TaxID=3374180 RepID=UPI0037577B98